MSVSYTFKEVDKLLKNPNKNQEDLEKIQSYLYSLPYFQNLFNEVHKSLIPKLIKKFRYGQSQPGASIIENGNNIKDFFIILGGTCLELSKNKQKDEENQAVFDDLEKTPFLKILKQSEERKRSLLFQQSPSQQHTKGQVFRFKEENLLQKIDSVDESEQTASQEKPCSPQIQQKSQFSGAGRNTGNLRPEMEEYFVMQYRRKYEKKGYTILNTLKDGDYFGGVTKKGGEQTYSDIICCTKVEYVCLSFEDYWNILSLYQHRMCEQKIKFLHSYRFLQIYTDHYLNKRLIMFEEVLFNRNQILFEESEDPKYIYFVAEGEFVMHKNVDFKKYLDNCLDNSNVSQSNVNKQQSAYRVSMNSDMTTSESEENNYSSNIISTNICQNSSSNQFRKNIIITYLNQGSYIGLSEILTDQKYTYTVSCYSTTAKVYRLFRDNFERFFYCEANVEIMAQDCLGKEKIYDDTLQKHASVMKEEYLKVGENQIEKNIMQIFETNRKKSVISPGVTVPAQHRKTNSNPRLDKELSVIDQRINEKLNSETARVSKKEILKEKTQHLQDTILNSINSDPYFRRRLLKNLSTLGFKINAENCNLFRHLRLSNNVPSSRTSSLSNLQELTQKQKVELNQYPTELEQIPEVLPTTLLSPSSLQTKISHHATSSQGQQLSRGSTLKQNFFNNPNQQNVQRERLSFILGMHDKKQPTQKSNGNGTLLNRQLSIEQNCLKNSLQNSPSIEDLKCFENNLTYRKDNDSEPTSPQVQNECSQFNSKTSINFYNNEHEFLTATAPINFETCHSAHNHKQYQQPTVQNNRMSSLSPESTFVATQEGNSKQSQNQGQQQVHQQYSHQKTIYTSRKSKMEAALSVDNPKKITPTKQKDEELISPIHSPFSTFRSQLLNNYSKNHNQQQPENDSPIKLSQQSSHNTLQFNSINLGQLYCQNQRSHSLLPQSLPVHTEVNSPSPTDPSYRKKIKFSSVLNSHSTLQQQESQPCSNMTFSSINKRQNAVNNFQFNLQGGNVHQSSNHNLKQFIENMQVSHMASHNNNFNSTMSATNTQSQQQFQQNIHTRGKSQKSFKDKLHLLVDKHIHDSISNKKSYIFNNNTNTPSLSIKINSNQQPEQLYLAQKQTQTSQSSRNATKPLQMQQDLLQLHTKNNNSLSDSNNHVQLNTTEQISPKIFGIHKRKQQSFAFVGHYQNSPSYTTLTENQENTANTNNVYLNNGNTTIQSPKVKKQKSLMLFKRGSIPLNSPASTKVTQQSTAQSPSFTSFQSVFNKKHQRFPSDSSSSNTNNQYFKNSYV